ncbi:MAG TPA: ribosome small subunit-dependent GTPase A, partial [Allocoleopsis sp.]
GLEVNVCLNKCDLVSDEEIKKWNERLKKWGYEPIFISVSNLIGIEELKERLNNKISILAGLSGVGKSSLINHLIPELNIRVSEVSGKLSKGRHTTRHVELFALPTGGLIADSPGFNQPDLDCTPEELGNYFPEVRERLKLGKCQFNDCSHGDEPNCIIRGDWDRYEHYRTLVEEAKLRQQKFREKGDIESTLKVKNTGKGQTKLEPKLEAKKYRRIARKTQLQDLQQLYDEDDM